MTNQRSRVTEKLSPEMLSVKVKAAKQEFDMAVTLHEAWKPTAYDNDLRQRMGVSYATNTFKVIRVALRREMLLALMRLWDNDSRSIGMERIGETVRDSQTVAHLAANRAARIGLPEAQGNIQKELDKYARVVALLVDKYSKNGSQYSVRKRLQTLRNERLAHRQTQSAADGADATDSEIEEFYQDNSKLVGLLLHLVEATAYEPAELADVYRHHSAHFWVGVRGENTAGHPNYRAPHTPENTLKTL
jgi:hypothetical protein